MELLVVIAIIGILAALLLPALNKARQKGWQSSCLSNIKQWGMAEAMYADDWNGTMYYDAGGLHFSDVHTPLQPYFGTANATRKLRTMRACPSRLGMIDLNVGPLEYNMPIGVVHYKGGVVAASSSDSPFFGTTISPYWPNLKSCPSPAQFVLILECHGNTINPGGTAFRDAVTTVGTSSDPVIPINRHASSVSVLFGDNHAESCTIDQINTMDAAYSGTTGSPYTLLN
ncbi:MAG: hypothetical protein ABSA12_09980 [Verrucomicrobiia bacterium]